MLARRQTNGRGRRGAAWFSPPGESLAFSILLRPEEPKAFWPRLALAAGLSVAEAIEERVPIVGIKWPNDIIVGGKKVAGILVEAGQDFAIVGIGINVNAKSFPPPVSEIATSVALEAGADVPQPGLLSSVIKRFAARRLQIGAGFPALLTAVRLRCTLTGNNISLIGPNGPKSGVMEGIGSSGELLLRTDSGTESLLQADEIRVIP